MSKKEVVKYLRKNIAKGYSIDQIRKELYKEGYQTEIIDFSIAEVEGTVVIPNLPLHYFNAVFSFLKKDLFDLMFFIISCIFLAYLFVNDTFFFFLFMFVTGLIAVVHHKHHDIIQAIIAYYNGFSLSALILFIFTFCYSLLFTSAKFSLSTLAFVYIIPLTFVYTLISSVLVLYFHERLLKEINYKGVFLFIFATNVLLIVSIAMGGF